jgi:hypothetical protein
LHYPDEAALLNKILSLWAVVAQDNKEAGHFPKTQKSLEELGVITTGSYFKAYYSFDDPEMWLTLIVLDRMGGKLEEAGAGAKKITWQYINTKGQWTCKNSENGGKTTIDDKYLPKACK